MLIRAPSISRKTSSAKPSGSRKDAAPNSFTSRRRWPFLNSSMTARAGMAFLRQLDRGIGERAAALGGAGHAFRHLGEPGADLELRIAGAGLGDLVPMRVGLLRELAQVFGHQHILGREVAIDRHLVGAGRLGDGVHAHRMDAMMIEEVAGRRQDPGLRRDSCESRPETPEFRFRPAFEALFPIPISQMHAFQLDAVLTDQYRPIGTK